MNELIKLIESLSKGVRRVMRTFFYLSFFSIFLIVSGWLRISCDGNEMLKDMNSLKSSIEQKIIGQSREVINMNYDSSSDIPKYYYIKHVLSKGESLYDLMQFYGVRWEVLKKVNHIEDVRKIKPGQTILIPVVN